MTRKRILIIEELGVFGAIYAAVRGRRFDRIYCISGHRGIIASSLRLFLKKDTFEPLDDSVYKGLKTDVNAFCIKFCDDFMHSVKGDISLSCLERLAGSSDILLAVSKYFFKRHAYRSARASRFISRTAKDGFRIVFLPADLTGKVLFKAAHIEPKYDVVIPGSAELLGMLNSIFKAVILPSASYILTVVKALFSRGLSLSVEPKDFKAALALTHGITDSMPWSDDFLLDGSTIMPEELLFVKEDWSVSYDTIRNIRSSRACYADFNETRIPAGFFFRRIVIGYGAFCLRQTIFSLANPLKRSTIIDSVLLSAMSLLFNEAFFEMNRVKAFILKDEYSPNSITRTIAINKRGGRTIGLMHSDYNHPLLVPDLAVYLSLDYYCIYGDVYRKFYEPFWRGVRNVRTIGVLRNDRAYEYSGAAELDGFCAEVIRGKGPRRLVSVFSGTLKEDHTINSRKRFLLEFYKGIAELASRYDNILIVIKTKSKDNVQDTDGFRELLHPHISRGRIMFAPANATYGLIRISDLVIGWRNTAVCLEAICQGKDAIFFNPMFDYADPSFNFYRDYDRSLMVINEDELLDVAGKYLEGARPVGDKVLEFIRANHDVAFDGKASKRFKAVVREALVS